METSLTRMCRLILLFAVLFSVGCSEKEAEPIAVTSVTLNPTSLELTEGDTASLTATVSPSNAENKKIIWISGDGAVATVNEGIVTAIKPGKTEITVKTDDGGKTATCTVIVTDRICPVESVSIDKTSIELTEGDEVTLTVAVNPDNATNKNVIWSSNDTDVATVIDGKVTAVKPGNATITVKSEDGGKAASCEVTVLKKVYPVESVVLDKVTAEIIEGDVLTLFATVNPDNATDKSLTWSSSDESVVTVVDGKVTAVKVGAATITVKTVDGGKTASCDITVLPRAVESVALDKTQVELKTGEEVIVAAIINPDNATNMNVTWTSDDENIATVTDGKIVGVNVGNTIVTVTTDDGGKTATCNVTVLPWAVESVSLDYTQVTMKRGGEFLLTATINPDNATNKNVSWSSSNDNIVSVVNGKLVAVDAGQATITVKTKDGDKTATCDVTVIVPVTGVEMEKSEVRMKLGTSASLSAIVQPVDATDKSLKWSINNTSVATISDNVVTAVGLGTAVVTVTTVDGGFTAETKIIVMSGDVNPDGSDMDVVEDEF